MFRAVPVASKACADRAKAREKELHKQKLKGARAYVNTKTPDVHHLEHLRNNPKKEQLLEDRYHEIDCANRILIHRMSDIMKHPTPVSMTRSASGPSSLNRERRKSELRKITQENQGILQRIHQTRPVLSHVEWADSFRKSTGYLKNATEFPLSLTRKMPSRPGSSTGLRQLEDVHAPPQAGFRSPGAAKEEEDLRYVLKEGKQLDKRYYLVEMATDGRTLTISAYDGDKQRTLELVVNEKNHRRLYRDACGDYSAIASKLRVEGNQLVLEPISGADPFETS